MKWKKRAASLLLAGTMLVSAVPAAAAAEIAQSVELGANTVASGTCGAQGDNVTWTLDSEGTLTISGTGEMANFTDFTRAPWYTYRSDVKNVSIEFGVTSIGDIAFSQCTNLTSITIPNSVTTIKSWAFCECTSLTSVTIPNSVTTIEYHMFDACTSLTSVTIPNSVTSIEANMFSSCTSLVNIIIPDSVTTIGTGAFCDCTSLTNIIIPDSVTNIGLGAFQSCTNLTDITIPNSVTTIGDGAFESCTSLISITIPNRVTTIGYRAFKSCTSLTDITIPNSVTTIGYRAFESCTSLTGITIPNSVTAIGYRAFESCTSLAGITIPDNVTSIGYNAFWQCANLTNIYFKGKAPSIGSQIFYDVTATAYYPANNSTWTSDVMQDYGGKITWVAWDPNSSAIISSGTCGDNLTWTLNDTGVLTISGTGDMYDYNDNSPWFQSESIYKVIIEEGVTSIGETAFSEMQNVKTIEVPSTMRSIKKRAFDSTGQNTGLKVYFHGNAPQIDSTTFVGLNDACFDLYYDANTSGWDAVIEKEYTRKPNWIRSEDKSSVLPVADTWYFSNSDNYFGNRDEGYYISKSDYDNLLSDLSNTEKKNIKKASWNKYNYNVDGEDDSSSNHITWAGSCDGLSRWVILQKISNKSLSLIDENATTLNQVDAGLQPINDNIQSKINFYHMQQDLKPYQDARKDFVKLSQFNQLKRLENAVAEGNPVLIDFGFKTSEINPETSKVTSKESLHAIVAYAIEEGDFTVSVDGQEYHFDHRILTYDSNNWANVSEDNGTNKFYHDHAIYYTNNSESDTRWTIPFYHSISTTNKFKIKSENDNARLRLVTSDLDYINLIDYETGNYSFADYESKNYYLDTTVDSFVIVDDPTTYQIVDKESNSDDAVVLQNATSADGSDASISVALPKTSTNYSVTTTDESLDFSMMYDNVYLSGYSEQTGTVVFDGEGKVALTSDKGGKNYVSVTADEGYYVLPWYTIDVESEDTTEISAELTDNGVLVEGDNLDNTTITGTNDDETKELTFSTEYDSVLISEDNDDMVVLVDTDHDGTYETDVNDAEDPDTPSKPSNPSKPSTPSTPSTPSKPSTPSTSSKSVSDIFSDIPATEWYVDAVQYVYDNDIMQGTGDGKFSPNATLTRAELAQILYNKAGKPAVSGLSTFTDVPATAWYAKAVAWAQQNNVVSGIGGNQFAPNQTITREQIAVMLYNNAGKPEVSGSITGFADAASVSEWAYDAVLWATQNDVVNGALQSNGTRLLNPTSGATRAETAALLANFYNQ